MAASVPAPQAIERLPLAVYLELVAHLQQLSGVRAELVPQTDRTFDYRQSQVGGILVDFSAAAEPEQQRAKEILNYYARRYGHWITN
jgi:hypothetical protein